MILFVAAGRTAGCVGLLTALALRHEVLGVVGYDGEVESLAGSLGLEVSTSLKRDAVRGWLARADLMLCVHGREIVSADLLALPRYGGINVHPCLYRYKGADPVGRMLR